ncbi:MAG: hypothetical protein EXR92_05480 [Gemmatimonadetes bacterium]|nr:hypothetical protein [Gemmatimonadota bacterium]
MAGSAAMRVRASISILFLLVLALPVAGQIPEGMTGPFVPNPVGTEAISRIYSPFCPGLMLEVCPSPNAAALRDSIHAHAYDGWSADELVDWVLGNYGGQYLAKPPGRGSGLWAWILPPLALLMGAGFVVRVLRRSVRRKDSEEVPSEPSLPERVITADQEARLRSAIREIEISEDPSF